MTVDKIISLIAYRTNEKVKDMLLGKVPFEDLPLYAFNEYEGPYLGWLPVIARWRLKIGK